MSYEVGANSHMLARIAASQDGREIKLAYLNVHHPIIY